MLINMYLTTVSSDSSFLFSGAGGTVGEKSRRPAKLDCPGNDAGMESLGATGDLLAEPQNGSRSEFDVENDPKVAKASGGTVGGDGGIWGDVAAGFHEGGLGSGGEGSRPGRWCCPRDRPACPKRALNGPRPAVPHPPKASAASWQSRPSRNIVRSWCQPRHQAAETSASNSRPLAATAVDAACFFMVLLPFGISLPAPIDRGRQRQPQRFFINIMPPHPNA